MWETVGVIGGVFIIAAIWFWAWTGDQKPKAPVYPAIPEPIPNPFEGTFPYVFANSYVNVLHRETPVSDPAGLKLTIAEELTVVLVEKEGPLIAKGYEATARAAVLAQEASIMDELGKKYAEQGQDGPALGASITAMFLRARAGELKEEAARLKDGRRWG